MTDDREPIVDAPPADALRAIADPALAVDDPPAEGLGVPGPEVLAPAAVPETPAGSTPPQWMTPTPAGSPPVTAPSGWGAGPASAQPASTPVAPRVYCFACGESIDARAEICPRCGVRQQRTAPEWNAAEQGRSKVVAGLLAIFLGWIGIHEFYIGKPAIGVAFIVVFLLLLVFTLGLLAWIPGLIGFIQGIWYLTMSDAEFAGRYPVRR